MSRVGLGVGVVHLLTALVLGVGGGAAAVAWLDDRRDDEVDRFARTRAGSGTPVEPGDRLAEAIAELRRDGVYVAPDGRGLVDEAGEREIEAAVADSPVAVYVVVWAPDHEIGMDDATVVEVLEQELSDRDAFLYLWEGAQTGEVLTLGGRDGSPSGASSSRDFVGDPTSTLVEAASSVRPDDFYDIDRDDADSDYYGGPGGGALLGAFLGSAIVGGVLVLTRIVAFVAGRRRLLPGDWRLSFDPPARSRRRGAR